MSELNAESVLASIVELRKSIAEQGERSDKATAELRASIAEQGKRMDKVLDELRVNNHRVGELTNKVGRIVEKVVVPNIVDKFNEKGSRFKGKKIYGAVSTAIAREKPVNYALSKGFYVLQQPDVMAVRIIDFPKGHSAKAW